MSAVAAAIKAGFPVGDALRVGRDDLAGAGFDKVEYLDLCDAETLVWVDKYARAARLLAAAWVGGVRLIDNIAV
jgi:pantoate--beta-alanine ligase